MDVSQIPIYHITHVDNLLGIIRDGHLWSDHEVREKEVKHKNIAYSHIKMRRMQHAVNVAKKGTLGNYVPFYFCCRSVMLYVIHKGHDEYKEGQESIVHLKTSIASVRRAGLTYCYTDRHAELAYTKQFDDLTLLPANVDLSIMQKKFWASDKEKKQAEFLIHGACPWSVIEEIGVYNSEMRSKVYQILEETEHQPQVDIRTNWYYEG